MNSLPQEVLNQMYAYVQTPYPMRRTEVPSLVLATKVHDFLRDTVLYRPEVKYIYGPGFDIDRHGREIVLHTNPPVEYKSFLALRRVLDRHYVTDKQGFRQRIALRPRRQQRPLDRHAPITVTLSGSWFDSHNDAAVLLLKTLLERLPYPKAVFEVAKADGKLLGVYSVDRRAVSDFSHLVSASPEL